MKSFTRLLALTATIVMAGWMNSASATLLSFTILGTGGSYTVNTGNITALTTLKTLPPTETVGACAPGGSCALAGITAFVTPVTFSPTLTINTTNGAFALTLTVGTLTMTFTSVSSVIIVPTGATTAGAISEQLNGTITGGGAAFLGQTVSLSEACTQTNTSSLISCTETVQTPGVPQVPEPMSLALLGIGLAAAGFVSRRRKS